MPKDFPRDYWVEIPGGRFTVGLRPDEARKLAEESASWKQQEGPEPSVHDWKNLVRGLELVDETGSVEWMTRYLLARYPAQEVELPPFSIARRPVLNREYKEFITATGEFPPWSWDTADGAADELPASGIPFSAALAFAEWAGGRLPFDAEWERAARGTGRHLFPWGNAFLPLGEALINVEPSYVPLSNDRATPTGLTGVLEQNCEWCADLWSADEARLNEDDPRLPRKQPGDRIVRGASAHGRREIPSLAGRDARRAYDYMTPDVQLRLVRADGRAMPVSPPSLPHDEATMLVRTFDRDVLRPALAAMMQSSRFGEYQTRLVSHDVYRQDRPIQALVRELRRDRREIFAGFWPDTAQTQYLYGWALVAASRESIRRNPPEHGVYVWGIEYRLAAPGRVHARPSVVYRMAFNKKLHKFEHRFRAHEVDTPLNELNSELLQRHIAESFWFFEHHADDDRSPFEGSEGGP